MAEEKIVLTLEANDEASRVLDQVSKSLRKMNKEANNAGNTSGLSRFVNGVDREVRRFNNMTRQYNNAMSGLNRSVKNAVEDMGAAIYDFTSDAINNFTNFSEQHAKVLGAMKADYDNTSQSQQKFFEDAQKLKDQAIQIGTYGTDGRGSLISVTDVSKTQEALVKAGVSANDIASGSVTKDVITFALANDFDTETAVNTAVSLGNQFNIPMKDWGDMLDKISHTADMSIVDVSDIVTSLKWASGISSGLGRSFEEVLGMLTVLGDFGLRGSQAGTGIQALLSRLLTGDTTVISDAQAEVAPGNALKKFYDFEKKAKPDGNLLPMADVIDELNKVMSDMTDEEQAWFAKKLFGLYQMKSAYALMNGEDVDLNDVIKEIQNQSAGTNQNKLDELLSSQYGQLTSLNNLWEGIKTDVGDRLNPFISAIRDELFNFLSSDGNYNINFDNLKSALDESCDLIEEKYGSAISNAVRNMGEFTIDLAQVVDQIGPEFGDGMLKMMGSLFDGNIFGNGGVFDNWGDMIDNMHESADALPEDLRDLGQAIVSTIDWFGKLITFNIASEIAQLVSAALQILTIAGGAVVNVAGSIYVNGGSPTNGTGTGTGTGKGGTQTNAGSVLSGSSVVGNADDVAKALGTTSDDVIATFGKKISYSIDDIAKGLGASTDEVIATFGSSIDDVTKGAGGLLKGLSKTGKVMGIVGTALQVVSSSYEAYNDFKDGDTKGGLEAIGGGVGSLAGSAGGALVGSAFGPLGTLIGAISGAIGGDKVVREFTGNVYDNFSDANNNYGTSLAGLMITGGLFKKDGLSSQQEYDKFAKSERKRQEETYGIKPSDFGLPKIFDKYYDGKTGEIPFEKIINELNMANKYPIQYGINEKKYGMDVNEAKSWQDSNEYKEYINAINGAKDALIETQKELQAQMVTIKKGDRGYDEKLDVNKTGSYSVWTGTQNELNSYLKDRTFIGDQSKPGKGTMSNPYIFSDLEQAVKDGIMSGMQNSKQKSDQKSQEYKNQQNKAGNITITSDNVNLSGDTKMPDMNSVIKQVLSNGYTAIGGNSKDLIKNEINNQIQIDDTVTMQPQFSVSAPVVNVDVKVDSSGNVTKDVSILNTNQGTLLNNWYKRTSSQYGKTVK